MFLVIAALSFVGNAIAEEEKEGKWWYIYNNGDLIGAYTDHYSQGEYKIACGSPILPVAENKYKDSTNYRSFQYYPTKAEARKAIFAYCKK